jgi:foldase protein PrsA
LFTANALAGCGSGDATVVQVGERAISRASVDHWTHVVAIRDYQLRPQRPVPAWVVPDPPKFAACVAHLKGSSRNGAGISGSPPKTQCRQKYQALREQVLGFLISGNALIQEGEARGLKATDAEIKRRFALATHVQFGSRGAYKHDLAITGETDSDQMFRAEIKVFTTKIEHQYLTALGQTQAQRARALVEFEETFPKRWARKTSCRPGYVVPACRQYQGTQVPRIIL